MSDTRVDLHDELPTHPRTGLRALGIGKRGPIWPIAGGSGEDEEDDEDEGSDDGEDDEDGEDDPFEGLDAEQLKDVARKLAKSNNTAKEQAKSWRLFAQGKSETAPDGRKRTPKADDEDEAEKGTKAKGSKTLTRAEVREMMEEAEDAARQTALEAVLPAAAEVALKAAGIKLPKDADSAERRLSRVLRLLDTDDVTIANGKLTGLDDAVDTLKREFPEYFGETRRKVGEPGNRGGGGRDGAKPKSTTEQQAAALFGRR